jgi:hypothetical protein
MRAFSANIQAILSSDNVATFFCVKVEGILNLMHTTLPYDITIPNLGTFLSDNGLITVEAPRLSPTVDRETYKVIYADPDFIFKPYFETGIIGTKLTVYVGFLNKFDYGISGIAPNEPFTAYYPNNLGASDILIAYSGVIDSHGYSHDNEQITVFLEGASPMASLDLVKLNMASDDALKKIDPTDTAFSEVHIGSTSVNFVWGKA